MRLAAKFLSALFAMFIFCAPASAEEMYGPLMQEEETGFASAMSDDELSDSRGMYSPVLSTNMSALLNGNSASNTVSGANSISNGALNNVAGLTSIIQNSGNNVIIQSSFQVNVNFQ